MTCAFVLHSLVRYLQALKQSAASGRHGGLQIPQHVPGSGLSARLGQEIDKGVDTGTIIDTLTSIRCAFSGSATVEHPNNAPLS